MKPEYQGLKLAIPGSTMLFGEHAVLRGARGLRAAVDRHVTMAFIPRQDRRIRIHSQGAVHEGPVDDPGHHPDLEYALKALERHRPVSGLDIVIRSDLGVMGLGSSAAIVAGVVVGLALLRDPVSPLDRNALYREGLAVIHAVTGQIGSGADLAASLWGGIVAVRGSEIVSFPADIPLTLAYSGYKTSTHRVVEQVNARAVENPEIYDPLFVQMTVLADQAVQAVRDQDWPGLGQLFGQYMECQRQLGVSDPELDRLCAALGQDPGISGAKIAGAGLGDCVIGLGTFANSDGNVQPGRLIHARIAPEGVRQIPLEREDMIAALTGSVRRPAKPEGRASAPVNIALVKYWGKRDGRLNLPVTDSLSVTLPWMTHTTVGQG
nr:hypothetical protein [Pseudomonadota bacterium]